MTNKTVSLVLGSGGARGLAHIGVINWLNQHGYEIQSIAGSSMGALIGGIYATGQLQVYTDWVTRLEKIDIVRLLDFSFGEGGFIKGERIINTLRDLVGHYLIEELPLSFTAVATDVDKQREVWLNKGPLFDAIRASIAIPSIFTPVNYYGRQLVDGSLINPIPIAPTLKDKTDITIAVNLSALPRKKHVTGPVPTVKPVDRENYRERILQFIDDLQRRVHNDREHDTGLFDIITKSIDTMQNTIARFELAAYTPDLVINVPSNVCSFYEFYRAEELITRGWHETEKACNNSDWKLSYSDR